MANFSVYRTCFECVPYSQPQDAVSRQTQTDRYVLTDALCLLCQCISQSCVVTLTETLYVG